MSEKLLELHILTSKATIAYKMHLAGLITKEDFKKQLDDLNCHCHTDVVLEKKHLELDTCYREMLNGILKSCD